MIDGLLDKEDPMEFKYINQPNKIIVKDENDHMVIRSYISKRD